MIAAVLLAAGCSDNPKPAAGPAPAGSAASAAPSASPSTSRFEPAAERIAALDAALQPVLQRLGTKVFMPKATERNPSPTVYPCDGYTMSFGDGARLKLSDGRNYQISTGKDNGDVKVTVVLFPDPAAAAAGLAEVVKVADACPQDGGAIDMNDRAEVKVEHLTVGGAPAVIVATRAVPASGGAAPRNGDAILFVGRGAHVLAVHASLRRNAGPSQTAALRDDAKALAVKVTPPIAAAVPAA